MKVQALEEIWNYVVGEIFEPFDNLQRLLEPFVRIYEFITETVTNIKEAWAFLVKAYV